MKKKPAKPSSDASLESLASRLRDLDAAIAAAHEESDEIRKRISEKCKKIGIPDPYELTITLDGQQLKKLVDGAEKPAFIPHIHPVWIPPMYPQPWQITCIN